MPKGIVSGLFFAFFLTHLADASATDSSTLATQDPDLFHQLNQAMADVAKLHPLNDNIEEVLKIFYSFDTPEVSSLQLETPALSPTATPTMTRAVTPTITLQGALQPPLQ